MALLPAHLIHAPSTYSANEFPSNITGFYRDATLHPLNLSAPSTSPSKDHFFRHIDLLHLAHGWDGIVKLPESLAPTRNVTGDEYWEEPVIPEWEWWNTQSWSLNMNERKIPAVADDGEVLNDPEAEKEFEDWSWLRVGCQRRYCYELT